MNEYRHFTTIVIGENPEEIISKYDNNATVEKHVLFELSRAKEYYDFHIKTLESALKEDFLSDIERQLIEEDIEYYKSIDEFDFYLELTEDYDVEEVTGNVYTTKNNINGKFDGYNLGKNFSLPLVLKNGDEQFSAYKEDVDWDKIHGNNKQTYISVWETVVEGRKPQNEDEEKVYNNMKNRTGYLDIFGSKENYVASNTAFWGYAYVDENGWYEVDGDQFEWARNFYDRFIKPLPPTAKISVYECIRK